MMGDDEILATQRHRRAQAPSGDSMLHDPWLGRWLPEIVSRTKGRPVLEIGCGHGDDTQTLVEAGLEVTGFDLSQDAVRRTRVRVPRARIERRDIRGPLPPEATQLGVVIASLSLHYFPWSETLEIVGRIREVLAPGGLLLCRLNSTQDKNFGAQGHREIEPHFYLVDGEPKRFFTEALARDMFSHGWTVLSLKHFTTRKYIRQKALWEAVVQRDA
jgi:SAM-dependent methyltransferase